MFYSWLIFCLFVISLFCFWVIFASYLRICLDLCLFLFLSVSFSLALSLILLCCEMRSREAWRRDQEKSGWPPFLCFNPRQKKHCAKWERKTEVWELNQFNPVKTFMQLRCQVLPYHGNFLITDHGNAPHSASLCVGTCVLAHLHQFTTAEIKAMPHSQTYRDSLVSHSLFCSICLNQPSMHDVQNVGECSKSFWCYFVDIMSAALGWIVIHLDYSSSWTLFLG